MVSQFNTFKNRIYAAHEKTYLIVNYKGLIMKQIILLSLMTMALSLQAKAVSVSAYTSLETCKILTSSENDPDAEIDYFTSVCEGREGFDVRIDGGDLRSWVSLVKQNTEDFVAENISFAFGEGQFPYVAGSKLEWRYTDNTLTALIVRMGGQDPEDYNNELQNLAVIRINKDRPAEACVVGLVNAKLPNANLKARAIADSGKSTCITGDY
jgi:hypothetical protein